MTSRGGRTSRRPYLVWAQVQVQGGLTTKEAAIPTHYGSPPEPGQGPAGESQRPSELSTHNPVGRGQGLERGSRTIAP